MQDLCWLKMLSVKVSDSSVWVLSCCIYFGSKKYYIQIQLLIIINNCCKDFPISYWTEFMCCSPARCVTAQHAASMVSNLLFVCAAVCQRHSRDRINKRKNVYLCHKAAGLVLQAGEVITSYIRHISVWLSTNRCDWQIISSLVYSISDKEMGVGHFRRVCLNQFDSD